MRTSFGMDKDAINTYCRAIPLVIRRMSGRNVYGRVFRRPLGLFSLTMPFWKRMKTLFNG